MNTRHIRRLILGSSLFGVLSTAVAQENSPWKPLPTPSTPLQPVRSDDQKAAPTTPENKTQPQPLQPVQPLNPKRPATPTQPLTPQQPTQAPQPIQNKPETISNPSPLQPVTPLPGAPKQPVTEQNPQPNVPIQPTAPLPQPKNTPSVPITPNVATPQPLTQPAQPVQTTPAQPTPTQPPIVQPARPAQPLQPAQPAQNVNTQPVPVPMQPAPVQPAQPLQPAPSPVNHPVKGQPQPTQPIQQPVTPIAPPQVPNVPTNPAQAVQQQPITPIAPPQNMPTLAPAPMPTVTPVGTPMPTAPAPLQPTQPVVQPAAPTVQPIQPVQPIPTDNSGNPITPQSTPSATSNQPVQRPVKGLKMISRNSPFSNQQQGLTFWGGLSTERIVMPGFHLGLSYPLGELNLFGAQFGSAVRVHADLSGGIKESSAIIGADWLLANASGNIYGGPSISGSLGNSGSGLALGGLVGYRDNLAISSLFNQNSVAVSSDLDTRLGYFAEFKLRYMLGNKSTDNKTAATNAENVFSPGFRAGLTYRF